MQADQVTTGLLSALPLPTLAINDTDRIVAINAAAEALLGQGGAGRHFVTLLRQPALIDAVSGCRDDGTSRKVPYIASGRGGGASYDVMLSRVTDQNLVVLSFQDVSHLVQAGQMRRDFVANVSHELRTPLTALIGFIETLQGPARDDVAARDRFLGIMNSEAERMNRLVGDLLSLSRVEAGERERLRDRVDLRPILHAVVRNLNPLAIETDVDLRTDLGQEALVVMGDSDQLHQVFTNLVENAIKYGGAGQHVDITASVVPRDAALHGPALVIGVRDHGPGIDPRHLPRLTERFYRADNHRSRALGGTGLGLAIVKHILNRHRGRLKIQSELGKGAEFCVVLPVLSD